jgi:hypothetical protein
MAASTIFDKEDTRGTKYENSAQDGGHVEGEDFSSTACGWQIVSHPH